jgi:hypothetical protein
LSFELLFPEEQVKWQKANGKWSFSHGQGKPDRDGG